MAEHPTQQHAHADYAHTAHAALEYNYSKTALQVLTVLWQIVWPVRALLYYLVILLLFILKFLYRPVAFLLQPVLYLGRFILACLIAPFQLLAKLETLYIYLGVAALVGLSIGFIVYYISGSLNTALGLDVDPEPPGRTAKEYRESKRKQKLEASAPLMSPGALSPAALSPSATSPNGLMAGYGSLSEGSRGKGRRGQGLLDQTIMEEVDSDY